jgi:hypothetical protein
LEVLPSAFCLLPSAVCFLLSAFCFCFVPSERGGYDERVTLADAVPAAALPPGAARRIGRLLRSEGCDLARVTLEQLAAGCSIYLEADTEVAVARALMGEHGIAQAPVVDRDDVVGFAVLAELPGSPGAAPEIAASR